MFYLSSVYLRRRLAIGAERSASIAALAATLLLRRSQVAGGGGHPVPTFSIEKHSWNIVPTSSMEKHSLVSDIDALPPFSMEKHSLNIQ